MNEKEIPGNARVLNIGGRTCVLQERSFLGRKGDLVKQYGVFEVVPARVEQHAGTSVVVAWKRAMRGLNWMLRDPQEFYDAVQILHAQVASSPPNGSGQPTPTPPVVSHKRR